MDARESATICERVTTRERVTGRARNDTWKFMRSSPDENENECLRAIGIPWMDVAIPAGPSLFRQRWVADDTTLESRQSCAGICSHQQTRIIIKCYLIHVNAFGCACGTAGFGCKSDLRDHNSASRYLLSCDQETGREEGVISMCGEV